MLLKIIQSAPTCSILLTSSVLTSKAGVSAAPSLARLITHSHIYYFDKGT